MDGLLVIDKPVGPTSHDVVARVRRILGEQRVGHTGTLDPGASGVLPLVVGRATRLARFLSAAGKSYDAAIQLGVATDTGDSAGTPVGRVFQGPFPERESIDRALDAFRGTFLQQPPAYSAKKIGGKRSHRLARAASRALAALPASPAAPPALAVLPAPVSVTVYALELGERRWRPRHAPGRLLGWLLCARARARSGRAAGGRRAPRGVESGAVRRFDARRRDGPRGARARSAGGTGRARPAGADAAGAHRADADPRRRPAGGPRARPRPGGFRRRFPRTRFRRRREAVPSARQRRARSSGSPSQSKGPGFCTPRSCWCNILSLFD